jgi:hypothetical protein
LQLSSVHDPFPKKINPLKRIRWRNWLRNFLGKTDVSPRDEVKTFQGLKTDDAISKASKANDQKGNFTRTLMERDYVCGNTSEQIKERSGSIFTDAIWQDIIDRLFLREHTLIGFLRGTHL